MYLILAALCASFVLQADAGYSPAIEEKLTTLMAQPSQLINELKPHIEYARDTFTSEEKEELINKLKSIKTGLCSRPTTPPLVLPILVTFGFGIKAVHDYIVLQQERVGVIDFFIPDLYTKQVDSFMFNAGAFIVSLIAGIALQIDHYEQVATVFVKENGLARQIDELIAVLKA